MPFKIKKTVSSLAPSGNSVLFNGSSQYAYTATSSVFDPGSTGAWTLECWVNGGGTFFTLGNGGPYGVSINCFYSAGKFNFHQANGSSATVVTLVTTNTYAANTWYHFSVCKDASNVIRMFINGVQDGSTTYTGTIAGGVGSRAIFNGIYDSNGFGQYGGTCYVSNARWIKGTALYTASFTPPTAPLTAIANTSLLTCNAATIVDASSNNFTITNNGGATVSSAVTPFTTSRSVFKLKKNNANPVAPYSVLFNGGSQYLTATRTGGWLNSANNFTLECWVYFTRHPTVAYGGIYHTCIAGTYTTSLSVGWELLLLGANGADSTTGVTFGAGGGGVSASKNLNKNTWYHIALVKNGATVTLYVDGISGGSSNMAAWSERTIINIGRSGYSPYLYYFPGYISNFRIVDGTAVYTSNFIPPSAPLTAVTNTALLTCNAPTIVDASSNNFTITNNNGATVSSTITPFSASVSTNKFKLRQVSYVRPVYMVATGGDLITTSGSYKIHTFTTVGTSSFTISNLGNNPSIEYLVVGGGGGGGYVAGAYDSRGGGGGAGGFRTGSISSGFAISNYSVVVGSGGSLNNNGQDSSFLTVTSLGGGGGGFGSTAAKTGGSGGGGGAIGSGGNFAGAAGTAGQGNSGGGGGTDSSTYRYGGGGGGAGSVGVTAINSSTACVGGSGSYSNITGTNTPYAGGGGGGQHAGGIGGGGAGTTTGSANTGGGGGGGLTTYQYVNYPGGAGGSGVVVIKYRYTD